MKYEPKYNKFSTYLTHFTEMLTMIISKTLFVIVLVILRNDPLLKAIHVHVLIKNLHNRNQISSFGETDESI